MLFRRVLKHVKEQNWAAVGIDFVIVVVGVFIGIQTANWNANQQEARLEKIYVDRLIGDLDEDISNFRELEEIFQKKAEFVSLLLNNEIGELMERPANELMRDLNYSTFKSFPPTVSATFDELTSSGRLTLLRDVEIRHELSSYYIWFAHLARIHEEPIGSYTQIVAAKLPGQAFFEWQVLDTIETSEPLLNTIRSIAADEQFEAAANAELFYASKLLFHVRESRKSAEAVQSRLRSYAQSP